MMIDGAAVRALVDKLPPHVFDGVCDTLPELLDGLTEEQVNNYVHWCACDDDYTPDDVAKDYGYEDYASMEYEGPYVALYDDGVLVIE